MGIVNLNITGFNGQYQNLNGHLALTINRLEIASAMMTIGHRARAQALYNNGFWGSVNHVSTVMSSLNSRLEPKSFYRNMAQSDKGAASYRLGQALAKVVAKKLLNIPFLHHVENFGNINLNNMYTPKIVLNNSVAQGAMPDLVGMDINQNWHILEAKLRSTNRVGTGLRQYGIKQVSMVSTVNGVAPLTRTSCCFASNQNGIEAWIDDPESDLDGDISFNSSRYFLEYYKHIIEFKDSRKKIKTWSFNNREVIPLSFFKQKKEKYCIAIDSQIYEDFILYENYQKGFTSIKELMFLENDLEDESWFIGADGIAVFRI